jgi:hypothetical protein
MLLIKNSPTTKEKSCQLRAYRLSVTPAYVRRFKDEVGPCASIQPLKRKLKHCTEQVTLRPLQNPPPPLTTHVQSPSTFDCLSAIRHNNQAEKSSHLAIFLPPFELREQQPRSDSPIAAFRVLSNSPFSFHSNPSLQST